MKNILSKAALSFLAFVLLLTGTHTSWAATDPELTKLVLSGSELSLEAGDSYSLTATGVYDDNSTENLTIYATWTTENSSVATVYNGTITAKAEGTATIVAEYDGYSSSITVKVSKKVKALTKDTQSLTLRKDGTATVTLTATYSDNTTESVSSEADWTSGDESVATVLNGVVTGVGAGSTTITATYGSKSVSLDVDVDVAKRITASQSDVSLLLNESEEVTITATFPDGTTEDVTDDAEWSSSNEAVADVLNGVITGYKAGTATITAEYGTKSVTIDVDVDTTSKVVVDEDSVFLHANGTKQLTLTATYADGTTADVTSSATWSSSDTSVAYVSKGKITGVKSGSAVITAKYSDKTITIDVDVDVANFLDASSEDVSLEAGGTATVTLTATYTDGTTEDVTSKATYTSSNTTAATASKGTITAYKMGETDITATYGGQTATISVSVDMPKRVTTTSEDVEVMLDGTYQADLVAVYSDGTESDVTDKATWTSSDESIATVSKGLITGIESGSATITGTYGSKSVTITVGVEVIRRIEADKTQVSLLLNGSETLTLTATYADGTTKDITSTATWTSSDESIAYVRKGTITGYKAGTATITATYGSKSTTVSVDVDQTTKLDVDEQSIFLRLNASQQLTLTATYNDGSTKDVTSSATWTSSDSSIAYVSKGKISGYKTGSATITATYSNKSVTVAVDVETAKYLDLSEDTLTMSEGDTESVTATAIFADGTTEDVTSSATWTSDDSSIAIVTKGSITAYGMGEATISAAYGSTTSSLKVAVDVASKLKTSKSTISLDEGDSYSADVYTVYADGSTKDVSDEATWTSADESVADVSVKGVITAVDSGTTTITATYNGLSVKITVKVGQTTELEADEVNVILSLGESEKIELTAYDEDGNETDVTDLATWTSSNTKYVTVKKGLIAAVSKGKATVTAEYGGQSVKISVEVDQVERVQASVTNLSMKTGETATLKITAYLSDGTTRNVTSSSVWRTSSYEVATVSNDGVVTATGSGKTYVYAKYADKTVKVPVTVDVLKYLETSEVVVTMKVGEQKTLSATATYEDLSEDDVTIEALWESSKITVATVKNGVIKANGKGKATITVEFGDKKTKVVVTVTQ